MTQTIPPQDDLRLPFVELDDRPDRDACPDADRLWDALENRLPRAERLAAVEHVARCGSCAQAWRLAHALGAMEGARAAERPASRGRTWAALAAAAAVTAIAVAVWQFGTPQAPPGFRTPDRPAIESPLGDGAALPRDAFELRWDGPAGARWRVRVATEDLRVLHESPELEATRYRVPADALAAVPGGARVVWQVRGRTAAGETLPPRTFTARVE